jgi:hypothetical protein
VREHVQRRHDGLWQIERTRRRPLRALALQLVLLVALFTGILLLSALLALLLAFAMPLLGLAGLLAPWAVWRALRAAKPRPALHLVGRPGAGPPRRTPGRLLELMLR